MAGMSMRERAQLRLAAPQLAEVRPLRNPLSEILADSETSSPQPVLRQFYGDTLPDAGYYRVTLLPAGKHLWAESLDELVDITEQHSARTGVYFGTAAFQSIAHGKQSNVLSLKALRLDIDAGPEKIAKHGPEKVYATQRDALADSIGFSKVTGLIPSYIVSSGAGLHLYYCLDAAIDPVTWLGLSKGLSRLGSTHSIKIDPSVTEDSARILRPPGTLHGNGQRVSVIKRTGLIYTVEQLTALLPVEVAPAPTRTYDTSINDDIDAAYQGPPSSALKVAEHCGALREVAASRGDVPEPFWRAMLGLVKRTVEGIDIAQEWSSGHDDYDPEQVERKFDAWSTGPTTCSEFSKHTSACETCQYAGKVKSPINLGLMTATEVEQLPVEVRPVGEFQPARDQLMQNLPDWNGKRDDEGNFRKSRPHNTVANVIALAALTGWTIRYNVMTKRTELFKSGLLSPRDDADNAALTRFGDVAVRAGMARDGLAELVDAAAGENPYHPALEWVKAGPWDNIPRLELFHGSVKLADPKKNGLKSKLMNAWALQAIGALLQHDGIAAQGVLVLNGPQDANKTRWVASLCPLPGAVRTGLHIDPANKDSVMQATACWIAEAGELDSTTRRSDVSLLKAFFTRPEDLIRPAYARRENTYKRRTVFVGTVNGTGFLYDETGNRRYWVLEVLRCELLEPGVMQQIWAEYLAKYLAGERWYLDAETKAALNVSNVDHTAVDPLRERVALAFDWSGVAWDAIDPDNWRAFSMVRWLSATDICMRVGVDRPSRADATRIGAIVRQLQQENGRVSAQVISRSSNGAKLLAVPASARSEGAP